ncbi:DUF2064 domain-containing protein [uncultured Microbacterium sp.]|uniref:TIGR04282 family arsenosugar biosynthesis glycosyltransferase n=1 Tax=uncultured Microbacterium sp. TaxID=191216 RepID=UPI0035CBC54C
MTALVVIAKACIPGRVKTRLHPPFTLEEAAEIAAASLADTLETAATSAVDRRILFFDGDPEGDGTAALQTASFRSTGFETIAQPLGSLDERIAAVFDVLDEPTLLIGMDTPQVTSWHLRWPSWSDAVLGLSEDGGFWALGMREPRGDLVRGIPMSRTDTGDRQLAALLGAGLTVERLDVLRDVDTADDAEFVAAQIPWSRFAGAVSAASSKVVS